MDLVLGRFADAQIAALDDGALTRLEMLMEETDRDLFRWISGEEQAPADVDGEMLAEIAAFHLSAERAAQ